MERREKMSREMRAKQFMPFAALKGYPEALRKKERIPVLKKEFAEEYQEELDRKLRQICRNDTVRVRCYVSGEYREITGTVSQIDSVGRSLRIGEEKIPAADICSIKKIPV